MDLVAACRVLAAIEERGSVTGAAASLGVAQSVASRRIFGLEKHLGGPLLERSARRAVLTPFGRDVAASARRLLRLADELELDAARSRLQPLSVAVPESCAVRDLAALDAASRAGGPPLHFVRAAPARRAELVASGVVRVAATAVPAGEAPLVAVLGAAGVSMPRGALRLSALRQSRARRRGESGEPRRLRLTREDDVPHVRDVVLRAGFAAGLVPGQLPSDASLTAALAAVLGLGDLVICSRAEARELGLSWRPFADLPVARGYRLLGNSDHDVHQVEQTVTRELAAALGAEAVSPAGRTSRA